MEDTSTIDREQRIAAQDLVADCFEELHQLSVTYAGIVNTPYVPLASDLMGERDQYGEVSGAGW